MFSDSAPPFVLPDCRGGRDYAALKVAGQVDVTYCDRYKPYPTNFEAPSDVNVPYDFFRPCRNREWAGERNHNWCYRCLAGCFLVEMHVYDAERTSDRAIRMSQ